MNFQPTLPAAQAERPLAPVIISLHGIRTAGAWQKQLATPIAAAGAIPVALDYGYFSALQLLTRSAREARVRWLHDEVERVRSRFPDRPLSMVAHSFGSYLTAALLEAHPAVSFSTVLLAGSIVRSDYPWPALLSSYRVGFIANSVGCLDPWPRIAQWCVPDAGDSGRSGFDTMHPALYQQYAARHRHGDHFNAGDVGAFWLPMLVRPQRLLLDVLLSLRGELKQRLAALPHWRDCAVRARLLVLHPARADSYWTAPGLAVADAEMPWSTQELHGLLPIDVARHTDARRTPALHAIAEVQPVFWLRNAASHGDPRLVAALAAPLAAPDPAAPARAALSVELLHATNARVDGALDLLVRGAIGLAVRAARRLAALL